LENHSGLAMAGRALSHEVPAAQDDMGGIKRPHGSSASTTTQDRSIAGRSTFGFEMGIVEGPVRTADCTVVGFGDGPEFEA
jgi:hypothetical protein